MRTSDHSWKSARRSGGQRFFIGFVVAAALSLVAFEWSSPRTELVIRTALPDEGLEPEVPPVVILEKKQATAPVQQARSTQVVVGEPDPVVVPDPDPAPEPSPDPGPITDPVPDPDPQPMPTETVASGPVFWEKVGVRPYFMDCLKRDPTSIEPCTEARIDAHLQRNLRIPPSVRGHVRTTVRSRSMPRGVSRNGGVRPEGGGCPCRDRTLIAASAQFVPTAKVATRCRCIIRYRSACAPGRLRPYNEAVRPRRLAG
ncbi:MAG: hypothetical protein R2818_11110 [Flavobacteriales bacterium]